MFIKKLCKEKQIEVLIEIILLERYLRQKYNVILGCPISRNKLNILKKYHPLLVSYNLFEFTNIIDVLLDIRNQIIHDEYESRNKMLCQKFCVLNYGVKDVKEVMLEDFKLIISYFNITIEKELVNDLRWTIPLLLKEDLNSNHKIKDENLRKLRNYLFHGYYIGETTNSGEIFSSKLLNIFKYDKNKY